MGKGKLQKFSELDTFPNVFQNFYYHKPQLVNNVKEVIDFRGRWANGFFGNKNPLILELACGRGDYTISLAKMFPKTNFLGVDLKGNRIWAGAKKAIKEDLKNVGFVRTEIKQLELFFDSSEISEIWITFPDPYLKKSKTGKRLTSPVFLDIYRKLLKPDGIVHLKTDSQQLFEYSLEVLETGHGTIIESIKDIYHTDKLTELLSIQTFYEKMHLKDGRRINYLKFRP